MSKPIITLLRSLYSNNFVTYYKSHVFHFNVEGNTFSQDHSLLNEIYDYLWAEHDNIGEQIRQLDKAVSPSLKDVLASADIEEETNPLKLNSDMLLCLNKDFDYLLDLAQEAYITAGKQNLGGLETYLGDYLKGLSKLNWKVKATIRKSIK